MWFRLSILLGSILSALASPTKVGIVGGQNASIADNPWLVALRNNVNEQFVCSGFLISPLWVVTTVMCELNAIHYVRAGSDSYSSGGVVVDVEEKIPHPDVDLVTFNNNIALLRLVSPISGDNIQAAVLPDESDDVTTGDVLSVAGWGTTDPNNYILAETLQSIDISAVNTQDCDLQYNHIGITDNMICGWDQGLGTQSPCAGDAGSPAIWNGKVIGITSHNVNCHSTEYPSIFTKLTKYLSWINKITGL